MSGSIQVPRYADQLRAISAAAACTKANAAKMTEEEITLFVTVVKKIAADKAKRGDERSAGYCIDEIRKDIARKPVPAIEAIFLSEGFEVRYMTDMTCGFCNMKDCAPNAHHGYIITW